MFVFLFSGIDVEVDVEHKGRRQGCGRRGRGAYCSRGRQGRGGSCHRPSGQGKDTEEKMEDSPAPSTKNVPEPMEGQVTPQKVDKEAPKVSLGGSKNKDNDGWTVLERTEAAPEVPVQTPGPSQTGPQQFQGPTMGTGSMTETDGATASAPPPALIYPPTGNHAFHGFLIFPKYIKI